MFRLEEKASGCTPKDSAGKKVKVCKQCGKEFADYAYSKTARCEECRADNRKRTRGKE